MQEERKIIEFCSARQEKNEYMGRACGAILLLLYTGMRIGELSSAAFDGTHITCATEKNEKGENRRFAENSPFSDAEKSMVSN